MRKWYLPDSPAIPDADKLAAELEISPLFLSILWRRGHRSPQALDAYLNPRVGGLTRPDLWPQIPEAARVLVDGLLAGKQIAVWGDYDVDGITSSAVCLDVLEARGFRPMVYLPDRLREGYGLNVAGVEELASRGCQLLLTVDCGVSDREATRRARELGMTVVVSDHHLPPDSPPVADAIVDPRMTAAGSWPCAHLAGVGVALYLMGAVNNLLTQNVGERYNMADALDLVALGTLADIMPVAGENRILVKHGLKKLATTARPGLNALKNVSGLQLGAELSSHEAVFRLAPRINASGRMGRPHTALELLRSRDYAEAEALAKKLDDYNTARKDEEKRIFEQAAKQADELLAARPYSGLALLGEDWHPGVIGIVASKIVETYNRPAIVLCESQGKLKGSGRSYADFNLYEGLKASEKYLLGFGGHRMAAGLSLTRENLDGFRDAFSNAVRECLGENPEPTPLILDAKLNFARASDPDFLNELKLMEPYGPANEEPVFVSPPARLKSRRPLGKSGEHVLLELEDSETGVTLKSKAWGLASQIGPELKDKCLRVAYAPKIDYFRGAPEIDVAIKDWKLTEPV